MNQRPIAMLGALRERRDFEAAAGSLLRAVMDVAGAMLAEGDHGGTRRVLRAMVHHRPADGYRRLAVMGVDDADVTMTGLESAFLPSSTAWRWIAEHRQAASIDVNLALIQSESPGGPEAVTDLTLLETGVTSHDSRLRMLRRGATHVYVLPLLGLRGTVDGLVSLEAHCPSLVGQAPGWSACAADLELLVALASPFVTELPLRPAEVPSTDPLLPVIGESMAGLVRILRVFREQRETILLGGPTGSGKSRLARWCHQTSSRGGAPFEVLDLTTVPEDLQLGELFGWRRGAFTGALRDSPGALGRAEGGTLFIDEIDKLSLRAQAGLLHVLEDRSYRPLGDASAERSANVRFIVGTNANLIQAVRTKLFREDLYYRVNVLPVQLPSLADRPDEIGAWAAFMAQRRHEEAEPGGRAEITSAGLARLVGEAWPGNLRQLDNIVRRAYALAVTDLEGDPERTLIIDEEHLIRALAYESPHDDERLVASMHAAATAFLAEARRRQSQGGCLDLDLAESFKGFVLAAALEGERERDGIFQLFGKQSLIKSRNHHKVLRREIERAEALCRAVSGTTQGRLTRLLGDDDGDGDDGT